ncbi:MAG: branched-chain amino acid ABC transporter permease [Rhizobiaceae bacterium]
MAGKSVTVFALVVLVLAAMPYATSESNLFVLMDVLIAILFATAYNLVLGQTGLLSFGHAAYFGLGAYTVALLQGHLGLPMLVGIAFGPFVAGFFAMLVALLTVRLSGMYFAMLTLSFAQLIYTIIAEWYSFTGGDNGLPVTVPDYFFVTTHYFYLTLGIVAASVFLLWLIVNSPFGVALLAIRENPQRASFVGLNVKLYQVAAFTISGAFSGLAGALSGSLHQMAFPSMLYWTESAQPVLMALAGGIHTFFGPAVGAAIFTILSFYVASYSGYPLLIFGIVVLLLVMFLPEGVVGTLRHWVSRSRKNGPEAVKETAPADAGAGRGTRA